MPKRRLVGGAQFVTPPTPSGRTDTTVVVPEETRTVTLPTPAPAPTPRVVLPDETRTVTLPSQTPAQTPRVVLPTPSETTCTKSVSGQCTTFTCTDGSRTNTCDLACKVESAKTSNTQEVAKKSENAMANEGSAKIVKITPDVAYAGSSEIITVDFLGANGYFESYDAVMIGNEVVPFYVSKSVSHNLDGSISGTFYLPKNIVMGPKSLTLINKKVPKSELQWSEKFLVTAGIDTPTIVSVTPSHGKAGDIIQMKVAKGKKNYTKSGFPSIAKVYYGYISSTITESASTYTIDFKLTPEHISGMTKLDTVVGVVYGPNFTVDKPGVADKPGVIESFLNYMGGFFK